MSKITVIYACQNCDAQYQKWLGRCLECGQWGTISEQIKKEAAASASAAAKPSAELVNINDVTSKQVERRNTGIHELDRVLGGGIVPGSLILLGGEPGIGKSTLSLQLAHIIDNSLYISGEESIGQIKLRFDRLGLTSPGFDGRSVSASQSQAHIRRPPYKQQPSQSQLMLANETEVGRIVATIEQHRPALAVIDSIQTISSEDVASEAGSPAQIRSCAVRLLEVAKRTGTAICIIGHVTKDGFVAGPKTLEHLVDTVLYLEGERSHAYRILRTVKNRFGETNEVGVFEMVEEGLKEVQNPSQVFLDERGEHMPGSIVTCLMEGTRPILVEVQALVNKTNFGYPVRKASGFDLNRLHVLAAVLQKRAGLNLSQYDIHINVVGGIEAGEPAADLAVCLAIASSYKDTVLGSDLCAFGEVGLGGEVRSVQGQERRIKEAANLGMKRVIAGEQKKGGASTSGIKIITVKNLVELIKQT